MAKPLPGLDVPVLTANGMMNQAWFEYFQSLQSSVGGLLSPDPSFTVVPITPGSTSYTPTTGVAIGYTGFGPPVIQTSIQWIIGMTNQNFADNFATIANALTKAAANHTSIQTAVSALNTRVTALENTENAVISDLDARFP